MEIHEAKFLNHVHQFIITASRHLWVTKGGEIHHQKKPFDISLTGPRRENGKTHLIHYLVKDLYSGRLYGETSLFSYRLHAGEFLYRAWPEKEESSIYGMPQSIVIARSVIDYAPYLEQLLPHLNIEILFARSGFDAGVRDIQVWEQGILRHIPIYAALEEAAPILSASISSQRGPWRNPTQYLHKDEQPKETPPPPKEEFFRFG
jgi:hypothetical protein